ncbi:MAG: hypothetical protein EBV53_04715 [Proteobacteria bacterium]|nr:hypothetical protein [Pseudomonadota bacterium]
MGVCYPTLGRGRKTGEKRFEATRMGNRDGCHASLRPRVMAVTVRAGAVMPFWVIRPDSRGYADGPGRVKGRNRPVAGSRRTRDAD